MNITYKELRTQLQDSYPMVKPFHYWIISSPYTYPSMTVYNDEKTRVFDNDNESDVKRFNEINFENCKVYQCDGMGKTDVDTDPNANCREEGFPLSEYVDIPEPEVKTWRVNFVFDCSNYGSLYRTITCSEENFSNAYKHELMLARIQLDLHYDEPSVMIKKEEIV